MRVPMGDIRNSTTGGEPTQLRRQADEHIRAARECLDAAEKMEERGKHRRRVDTQGRRWYGHLLVIKVTVLGLLAGAWGVARRPQAAMAAAGIMAVPIVVQPAQIPPTSPAPAPVEVHWGGDETREPPQATVEELQAPGVKPSPESSGPAPSLEDDGTVEFPDQSTAPTYATRASEPAQPLGEDTQWGPETTKPPASSPLPLPEPTASVSPDPVLPLPEPDGGVVELTPAQLCIQAGFSGPTLEGCVKRVERGTLDLSGLGLG